tara:strand:+ start:724 stop:2058 length:1335 start_codon:yes stop_codon:yes gene_type:complete
MIVSDKKLKLFLFLEIVLIMLIFYQTSKSLSAFVDEYLSITSNSSFFKNFDFNAGSMADGSYGVILTSGPLSAVGSVIGWSLSKDLIIARFSNFIWALFLHIFFIRKIKKYYKFDQNMFLIFSVFSLLILPWYFGLLYSLGEIVSTIIFFYALLLFEPKRKLSLLLVSFSIFYGKLILLFLFFIFYATYIFLTKEYKKIFYDALIFSIPPIFWLACVAYYYTGGSVFDYVYDFVYFNFINNRSAGIKEVGSYSVLDYLFSYKNSEVVNWNLADLLRVLISPILFIGIIFVIKEKTRDKFNILILSIVVSSTSLYLWFWIFSPTKWIRYSQHFLLIQILFILFYLTQESNKVDNNIKLLLISTYFSLFFSSYLLILFFLTTILLARKYQLQNSYNFFPYLMAIFMFVNTINVYFELQSKTEFTFEFDICNENLMSKKCYQEYINQ